MGIEIVGPIPHETLAEALAAFQAQVPKMSKDERAKVRGETKDGRSYDKSYDYAGLDQFVEIVEPVLGKHGLSVTSKTTFHGDAFVLEVSLLHKSGERETAFWPLPDPRRAGPQDIGSAMTYGRRYLGWGLTGTFPSGIDDDGAKAQTTARDSWESAQPRQRPVDDRQARAGEEPQAGPAQQAPKTSWTDDEVTNYQVKIATSELPAALKGYDWMAGKDLHNRVVDNGAQADTATKVLAVRLAEEVLLPDNSVDGIDDIKLIASGRGLMKVQVSASETLEEVIHGAREVAVHAAVEQAKADTPDPGGE